MPVGTLKVDRSFVADIQADSLAQALIGGLVQLGQAFGFEIVVEGIETAAPHSLLLQLGCQFGHGHLFARPLDAEAATKALTAGLAVAA